MFEAISLFGSSILAAISIAACLSFIGPLMVARGNGTHVLAVGQGASLGVMVGILFLGSDHGDSLESAVIPWICGFLLALGTFYLLERWGRGGKSGFVVHLSAFALLSALGGMMRGFFPQLESQVTNLFLGDVVTISHEVAIGYSVFGLLSFFLLLNFSHFLLGRTFEIEILKINVWSPPDLFFLCFTITMVTLSVLSFGLLFTLSCLFIPTAILSASNLGGAHFHILLTSSIGALGAALGFAASLVWEGLGTSSAIVGVTFILSLIVLILLRILGQKTNANDLQLR